MSRVVKLSTGEEVHLKEHFTHKAEKVFTTLRDKGVIERIGDDGKVVREYPTNNYPEALEAAVMVMIERVTNGEVEIQATVAWLENLSETDYEKIGLAVIKIRKEAREQEKKS